MNVSSENNASEDKQQSTPLTEVKGDKWGQQRDDHYGYASEEERKAKRGLEDWELVEHVPLSQKGVPRWFIAVIVAVLLVAIGLSFPFWGNRAGYERSWVDWGFGAAILYLIVFGGFVYFMVNRYSPSVDGMEEDEVDPAHDTGSSKRDKQNSKTKSDNNAAAKQ
jgi:hypothetical protein